MNCVFFLSFYQSTVLSSENTNWYKNLDKSFFRFVTMHAFHRQTDRRTDRLFSSLDCVCIVRSTVKTL